MKIINKAKRADVLKGASVTSLSALLSSFFSSLVKGTHSFCFMVTLHLREGAILDVHPKLTT